MTAERRPSVRQRVGAAVRGWFAEKKAKSFPEGIFESFQQDLDVVCADYSGELASEVGFEASVWAEGMPRDKAIAWLRQHPYEVTSLVEALVDMATLQPRAFGDIELSRVGFLKDELQRRIEKVLKKE